MKRRVPINPMPTVEYDGTIYKVRSRKITIPDLESLRRIEALVWLGRYTIPRGYSRKIDIRLPRVEVTVR